MRVLTLLVAGFGLAACATDPGSSTSSEPLPASAVRPRDDFCAGVTNFAKVSEALWRGAQPTAQGFRNLETAGAKTVVNLRSDHDDSDLLVGTGLNYVWIKTKAWDPDEEEVVSFLKLLQDREKWPIFVHCAEGKDRTGYCVASYRIVEQGWKPDDAIREMRDFGFNSIWFRNTGFLRRLNVDEMKARVAAKP